MDKKNINLVLIHGFMFNKTIWNMLAEKLPSNYTLHMIDLPGYSGRAQIETPSLSEIAQDVFSQIAHDKKYIWVGFSLGGLIAQYLAKYFPENTLGVITIASNPKFIKSKDWECGGSYGAFYTFKNAFKRQPKMALQRFLMLQSQDIDFSSSKNLPLLQMYTESLPIEVIMRDLEILEHTDLRPLIRELKVPQLNILAENDRLVTVGVVDELKHLSPHAHSVIIKNAGHGLLLSHANECLTAIQNFINESNITE